MPTSSRKAPNGRDTNVVPATQPPFGGTPFPVIGIGCSAGGLEALEKLLRHTPPDSGAAFVVVQHLAPEHPSALPALLQHYTLMRVIEAGEGQALVPNMVYVIPPDRDLALLHGRLHLMAPVAPRGLRLPIDFFLRSLALDSGAQAVGILLSGMGADGVLGLRAIKEHGGVTLVQDPASAQADSMPASAIAAGVVDIVDMPEAMYPRLAAHLSRPRKPVVPLALPADHSEASGVAAALDQIILLLRDHSGNDFSLYKSNTLFRRIERRREVHQIAGIDGYVRFLRDNPQELGLLFKELLIGVTSFFRDPAVWRQLRDETFPALFARYPQGKALRAWVVACSTGEEAYSLAITFKEALCAVQPPAHFSLLIYATDLDPDAIDAARRAVYPGSIAANASPAQLSTYFIDEDHSFRVCKAIRETVVFATQNVISDPPFTKLDVLSCRNLLIYFGTPVQNRLIPLFHYALAPEGTLLLGTAETVGNFQQLFAPTNAKTRVFRRLDLPQPVTGLHFPGSPMTNTPNSSQSLTPVSDAIATDRSGDLGQLTDQLIQQTWAPAAVLVNAEGDILYVSGRTGKYLEPAAGKTNINIHAMAREGLREALTGVIRKALKDGLPIRLNGLRVGTNGGTQIIDLVVQALDKPEPLRGRVLIIFKDVPPPPRRRASKLVAPESQQILQRELEQAREALQETHEEMQSTVEELKSSNEELQSTNEEMQSTNEELTTSKEELQSLNEELQTVNAELQSKVDELEGLKNDMANLLNSTEIATVFLDGAMNLRRYTTHATRLFKLIPGDIGRPLSDVATTLDYPQLKSDAVEVLHSLIFKEQEVSTRDDRWYRIRIMPYRTQDNVIDGVVITFINITEIKQLEAKLRQSGEQS